MRKLKFSFHDRASMWAQGAVGLAAALVLVACGGGGADTAVTPAAATPTVSAAAYTSGTITGFGSIIVNGVRFDDSGAEVLDDDGGRHGSSALQLGASVEIESGSVDRTNGKATAVRIRYGSAVKGPVEAVDTAAGTVTVLGQTVSVSDTTVFESTLSGGLAAVSVGQILEVHGQYDSTAAVWSATRIDLEDATSEYRVRGAVAALDTTAKTFRIGTASIYYGSAAAVPAALADGLSVRVKLQTTAVSGQWVATSVKSGQRSVEDRAEAEVHGLITAWTSATSFSVNDLPVDASTATFPDGQSAVVLGARVEVSGAVVNGVLVATRVHVDDGSHGTSSDAAAGRYELHGTLSALDTTAKTFTLRGLTVDYASVTEWRKLTEASLVDGLSVEVKGVLSSDGTRVVARRIQLED